ncbi:phage holin [Jeotgalibacillus soli]|uniref:Holin n=1 Tax=Jeotgalibacillus soli TaxID=889306 RepID=A0A0C2VMX4_9BACL|nr:phage holin [Jeotgalibacillus soli]KIL45801.1 hypothetical protein KP78_21500 [Jeotgalibacillus soli]
MEERARIDTPTIIRTTILLLALINTTLQLMGYKVLPLTPENVETFLTIVLNVAAALAAWWKDNDIRRSTIVKKKKAGLRK